MTHQMHTYTFGDPKSFAFEVHGERVNILIGGQRITERDDSPYLLSFVTQLTSTAEWLRRRLNFLEHESLFNDLSVEDGYRALFDAFVGGNRPALDDAIRKLRFADWGPVTDAYLTFLIPRWGRLYLATGICVTPRPMAPESARWLESSRRRWELKQTTLP